MKNQHEKSQFKAGMYLLETLTSGMYNEPLSIYREYIQNSVDSIDQVTNKTGPLKVKIVIDPFKKTIKIKDNGIGISSNSAHEVLSSIGSSKKHNTDLRGFRGIGRLGGLAFCDRAIFRAKAAGEDVESIQEWDCEKLRKELLKKKKGVKTLKNLFDYTTSFYQKNGKGLNSSYFELKLEGVSSFRSYILDFNKVKNFLYQVAPLPFNNNVFPYAENIENYLKENISNYSTYPIYLNSEPIFKEYKDKIRTNKKGYDFINGIEYIKVNIKNSPAAFGWIGIRKDNLGSILKSERVSGIRVRVGNLLLGDEHLLDNCFRETRFNSYNIGEIYVTHPNLIPNARRDDFIDNDAKTLFYDAIEQKIGLPVSKKIRLRSQQNSKQNTGNTKKIAEFGSLALKAEKESNLQNKITVSSNYNYRNKLKEALNDICSSCPNKLKILKKIQDIE